jgi:hypothetical protein
MYSIFLFLVLLSSIMLSAAAPHIGPVAAQEKEQAEECQPGTIWNGRECEVRMEQPPAEEIEDEDEEVPSVPLPEQEEPVLSEPPQVKQMNCPPGTFWNGFECMSGERCITESGTGEILCISPDLASKIPLKSMQNKNR